MYKADVIVGIVVDTDKISDKVYYDIVGVKAFNLENRDIVSVLSDDIDTDIRFEKSYNYMDRAIYKEGKEYNTVYRNIAPDGDALVYDSKEVNLVVYGKSGEIIEQFGNPIVWFRCSTGAHIAVDIFKLDFDFIVSWCLPMTPLISTALVPIYRLYSVFKEVTDGVYAYKDFVYVNKVLSDSIVLPKECSRIFIDAWCSAETVVFPKEISAIRFDELAYRFIKHIYVSRDMSEESLSHLLYDLLYPSLDMYSDTLRILTELYENRCYHTFLSALKGEYSDCVERVLKWKEVIVY